VAGGNRIAWPFGPSLLPPTPHLLSLQGDSNVFSTKTRKEKDKREKKQNKKICPHHHHLKRRSRRRFLLLNDHPHTQEEPFLFNIL